ncbi:MAG: hypothetical protein M0D53_17215 [Flavobacterium sp. JAD_PAG50586_2]|nr:MAG: hypothetical protein M0D53_17215 [Flavobacterium sp. JAD_PAG50586_2]
MKTKFYFGLLLSVVAINCGFSQEKKSLVTKENSEKGNVYMTWNKDTPEQEMNDDIKALSEYGVTISYSNVKRNSENEITAVRVEYIDREGNKGSMEVDNKKPINTIRFFKNGDSVGFGEPGNSDFIAGNFGNGENFMKQFNFGNGNAKSFNFSFPDNGTFGKSNSKIIIENDGRKPLVIEDGKVIEGGDDYTSDELEKIKKDNTFEFFGDDDISKFNFSSGNDNLSEQLQKMQEQLDKLMHKYDNGKPDSADEKAIKELKKTKEEMLKAKEEMEKTTKELKKAKSSLKTQKA